MANTIGKLLVNVGASIDGFRKKMDQVEKRMYKTGRVLSSVGRDLSQTVTLPLVAIGGASIAAAADFEKLEKSMVSMMGDAKAAEKELAKLKEVARAPGLGFEQAVKGSVRLQAVGLDAETSRRALSEFGNAIALVGGSAADLDGVSLALAQIAAKGKVSAEEINQLAERVPQIRMALQDAFGTADTEVLQKMGVDFDEFINGVLNSLGNLPRASNTFANSLENMRMSLRESAAELGATIIESLDLEAALEKLNQKIQNAVKWFKELSPTMQGIIIKLGIAVAAIGPILVALGSMNGLIRAGISVLSLFSGAMSAMLLTPVGLTVTAVSALVVGLVTLYNHLQKVKDKMGELKDMATQAAGKLLSFFPGTAGVAGQAMAAGSQASRDRRREDERPKAVSGGMLGDATFLLEAAKETGEEVKETNEEVVESYGEVTKQLDETKEHYVNSMGSMKDAHLDSFQQIRESTEGVSYALKQMEEPIEVLDSKFSKWAEAEKPWFAKPESAEAIAGTFEAMKAGMEGDESTQEDKQSPLEKQAEMMQRVGDVFQETKSIVHGVITSMNNDMKKGEKGFAAFGRAALKAAAQIVKAKVVEAISNAIAGSFSQFGPIAGAVIAGVAAGGVSALFDSFINRVQAPALAKGGLAFGPTMALVGDNQGAKTDPEVIAPLSKLKDMIGGGMGNVSGTFRIDYKTLDLLLDLRQERKNRLGLG